MKKTVLWAAGALLAALLPVTSTPASAAPADAARTATASSPAASSLDARRAARLSIPAIGVNAGIIPVGVTRSGELAVGRSVTDVYRWRHGVFPGDPGSAVLAGHTWSRGNGVFDNLGKLRKSSLVTVGRAKFRVTKVRKVRRLSAKEVRGLYSDMGKPRLVLITCGDRNAATGVYASRILVYAKKVRR